LLIEFLNQQLGRFKETIRHNLNEGFLHLLSAIEQEKG
jgi:hypothetical protein